MKDKQGRRANEQGDSSRRAVAAILLSHGFREIGPLEIIPGRTDVFAAFESARRSSLEVPERAFAGNVPLCFGVHDNVCVATFLVRAQGWPEPVAIMCKEQNSSGSAIEKLHFLYINIADRFPCRSFILFDGVAFTPPVLREARRWISRSKGRIAGIFPSLGDFRMWNVTGCLYPPSEFPAELF